MAKLLAIADSVLPVPPRGYGGTERNLYERLQGFAEQGYEITLLGHPDSTINGKVIGYPTANERNKLSRGWIKWRFRSLLRSLLPQFDIVHAVARLDYLLPALQHPIPKHYFFHNPITDDQIAYLRKHARGRLVLSACGKQMTLAHQSWGCWRPIHNAINVSRYAFHPEPQKPGYLAFLGRLTANKGVKEAIQIARQAGMPLHLAGNISDEPGGREYFEQEIKPQVDGSSVLYLGEVDDEQKEKHLGQAVALLNPVQWDEPFGNVTIEALICGTPVLACPRGELPYVVEDGITGYLSNDIDELTAAVKKIPELSRERCRQAAIERFSTARMVEKNLEVLDWLLSSETTVPAHWQTT